jgi:hypothetical protein
MNSAYRDWLGLSMGMCVGQTRGAGKSTLPSASAASNRRVNTVTAHDSGEVLCGMSFVIFAGAFHGEPGFRRLHRRAGGYE